MSETCMCRNAAPSGADCLPSQFVAETQGGEQLRNDATILARDAIAAPAGIKSKSTYEQMEGKPTSAFHFCIAHDSEDNHKTALRYVTTAAATIVAVEVTSCTISASFNRMSADQPGGDIGITDNAVTYGTETNADAD
jgi:hypothetical protein